MNVVPAPARQMVKRLAHGSARAVAAPLTARRAEQARPSAPALLVGVYSERNAANVRALVEQARREGWTVRLRALDRPAPDLAEYTVEIGSAERMAALYCLATSHAPPDAAWIVAVDDDVALPAGGLARFVALCESAELDLAQPAHDLRSFWSHHFTVASAFSVVRETWFVEAGPMICVAAAWWERLMAPCVDLGQGWGAEALWDGVRQAGARFGIVDATRLRHLGRAGQHYPQEESRAQLERLLAAHDLASLHDLQTTVHTWRPWRRRAPWVTRP